jgi:Ca2+-dependent lipid-binding protein
MTRYQIAIKASNLPRDWLFRRPNPYAEVFHEDGPLKGKRIGKTETVEGTSNPDFVRVIFVELDDSQISRVKITLSDNRGVQQSDNEFGSVIVEPALVFRSPGHTQRLNVGGRGGSASLEVSVNESNPAHIGSVTLRLRGLDIRNVEPGLLGLGRSDPFFEIAKKDADHSSGQVRWNVVYRSDYWENHLNPYWEAFEIGMEELCNGDMDYPLRISVLDHNKGGRNKLIGAFETTLACMKERISIKGNADRDRAFELFQEGDVNTHGLICILQADIRQGQTRS